MDNRRLDTAGVIASGILDLPAPESNAPADAVFVNVEEWDWTTESLKEGLLKGGLDGSMYYGCWKVWKDGDLYSGQLMQYRAVTDSFKEQSLEYALVKAEDWASSCQG